MSASKLRKDDVGVFIVDIVMTIILIVNLLWFAFDFAWMNKSVRDFFHVHIPSFYNFYRPVHFDFAKYDLIFVIIFLTEFLTRWVIAVVNNVYKRWFYYPLIHFYDALGLIPVGGFRFLRVLRLFSIIYRLQRMGIINIKQWFLYQELMRVKNIVLEEISDRVILRLLTGIQKGVEKEAEPGTESHLVYNAVYPHKQEIVDWISNKVHNTVATEYLPQREEIQQQIKDKVKSIMESSGPIQTLEKIPLIGKSAVSKLEKSISEGIFNAIDGLMQKLADEEKVHVEEYASKAFDALVNKKEGDPELNRIIKSIVVALLEEMKKQTAKKDWQQKRGAKPAVQ